MLVVGFLGEYDKEEKKIILSSPLLVSIRSSYLKANYNLGEEYKTFTLQGAQIFSSLFYSYSYMKLKDLLYHINNYTEKQIIKGVISENGEKTDFIITLRNIYNITFANSGEQSKLLMRIITQQNVVGIYTIGGAMARSNMYLSNMYHNFLILQDIFPEKRYKVLHHGPDLSLSDEVRMLYPKKGYHTIRALAHVVPEGIFPDTDQSFYLEYNLEKYSVDPLSVNYSLGVPFFRDNVIEAINTYLLYLKEAGDRVLKFYKNVYIVDDLDKNEVKMNMYKLNIAMYKSLDLGSEFHNLFVFCIDSNKTARIVHDKDKRDIITRTLQIIIPYSQVKKYRLHEPKEFYTSANINRVIKQLISDGALVLQTYEDDSVFVIAQMQR